MTNMPGLHVEILKKAECVYECNFNAAANEKADINSLIKSLKEAQTKINAFLSDVVKEEQGQITMVSTCEAESDNEDQDSDESTGDHLISTKKCKFAN